MTKRQCLFCDNPANRREDIFPDWILNQLQTKKPTLITGFSGPRAIYQIGTKATLKSRCVCESCNSGWMSDLETQSRPIIGPLLHDISIRLSPSEQFTVARWAIKTAMTGESISQKHRALFYKQTERIQLRLSRFPSHTLVWLGRCMARYDVGFFGVDGWNKKPEDPEVTHAYVTTILLRRLVMQVITIHAPRELSAGNINLQHRIGPWGGLLLRLNPLGDKILSWPPPLTFTEKGEFTLRDLVDRCSIGTKIGPIPPPPLE